MEKEIYQPSSQTTPTKRERPQQQAKKRPADLEFEREETTVQSSNRSNPPAQSERVESKTSNASSNQSRSRKEEQQDVVSINRTNDLETDTPVSKKPKLMRRKSEREAAELKKIQDSQGAEYYDYYDYYDETALKREKRRTNVVGLVILLAIVVVIGLGLFFGYRYAVNNYGSVGGAFGSMFGGKSEVTVEKTITTTGYPSHTITIPLKTGDTVQILDENLQQQPIVAQGNVNQPIEIPDSGMIPVNPNPAEATINVKPNIVVTSADGIETPVEFPAYTIEVPQVQLIISQPTSIENVTLQEPSLTIVGQAYADGHPVQVLINNQFQPEMDPSGAFIFEMPLTAGAFDVNVQALASQYRANTQNITGTLAVGEGGAIAILDADYEMQRTTESSMQISGTTSPNSNLTIPGAQNLQYDATTGKFSFTAPLLTIGQHAFTMTLADGSSQIIALTKTPNVDAFWTVAKPLDYNAAIESPDNSIKQSIYFDGFIESVDDTKTTPIYTMSLRSDPSKKLLVEYLGLTKPNINDTIWVFGDVKAVDATSTTPITVTAYYFYDDATMQEIRSGGGITASSSDSAMTDVSTTTETNDITDITSVQD